MTATFKPSEDHKKMVSGAYAMGMRQADICTLIRSENDKGITLKTLRKHFREELARGRAQLEYRIRATAAQVACDIDHPKFCTMNIWMQKTVLGINETNVHQITGPDGEPLSTNPTWVVVVNGK